MSNKPELNLPESRNLLKRTKDWLRSTAISLFKSAASGLSRIGIRLSTAIHFWIRRTIEARTLFGIILLVSGSVVYIVMEVWRGFGFWIFGGFPINFDSPKVPLATLAIALPLFIAISNRILRSIFLILFSIATTLIIQFGFSTPGIIASVWYPIIGVALGTTYYFRRFDYLTSQLNNIKTYEGNSTYSLLALELVSDRCKFYLDRWVVAILALATATGVMMTILWGDTFGAFIGTRAQKLTDAVYMVIAFLSIAIISGVYVGYPANSIYAQCADVALSIGESHRKDMPFE